MGFRIVMSNHEMSDPAYVKEGVTADKYKCKDLNIEFEKSRTPRRQIGRCPLLLDFE